MSADDRNPNGKGGQTGDAVKDGGTWMGVSRVADLRVGRGDTERDVEIADFLLENNIHHYINRHLVVSPEQLAFMVALDPDQIYVPCSDGLFFECMRRTMGPRLRREYARAWRLNMTLLASLDLPPGRRDAIRAFCGKRLRRALAFHDLLPQRLVKRLTSAVLAPGGMEEDPWFARKAGLVRVQRDFLEDGETRRALQAVPAGWPCPGLPGQSGSADRAEASGTQGATGARGTAGTEDGDEAAPTLADLRQVLDCTAFARGACLAACTFLPGSRPEGEKPLPGPVVDPADGSCPVASGRTARAGREDDLPTATAGDLPRLFAGAEKAMAALWDTVPALKDRSSTLLLLCDAEGGTVHDLALANFLCARGHRVIYAVKSDFYFHAPTLRDVREDPVLQKALSGAFVLEEERVSKKELLALLREWHFLVISDGTRERLNLRRVSVTFSRAWKEADLVLAKGWRTRDVLLGTSHEFTRDILCWDMEGGSFRVDFRPHAERAHKMTEAEINRFSGAIVADMKKARAEGRPVLFYSCVIGSIPGQTKTAIRLARAIVDDLRKRLPDAFIVNPATHFVEGMDGDDLMYMWEAVQRSGCIDIWLFETADDIERGFALLGEPMPAEWMGKDATYSTGCTKEMRIALEMQKKNPEMQIRGPDPANFFRRGDYGVGKYFDASLVRR